MSSDKHRPVLIVLNSSILHGSEAREAYPYPATVSCVGLVVSSLCVHVAAAAGVVEVLCSISQILAGPCKGDLVKSVPIQPTMRNTSELEHL